MPVTVNVSVTPTSLTIAPGDSGEYTATLHNSGQTVDQFTVSIDGLDSQWFSLPVSSVALFPNDEDHLKVILHPPKADAASGSHRFKLNVMSQENPAQPVSVELSFNIQAAPQIAMEIVQTSGGQRPHYHLSAINPGSGEATLQLKAASEDRRLKIYLNPENLQVPSGGHAEADVEVYFGWMSLVWGKQSAEFRIQGTATGATDATTVSAQATAVRWYKLLPQIRLPWLSKPPQVLTFKAATDDKREFRLNWSVKRAIEVRLDDAIVSRQGEVALRPTAARAYILTASNKNGSVTSKVDVQPVTVPNARTSDRIKVTLSTGEAEANAGGAPVPVVLQVQNTGEMVDKFLVEVEGIDPTWFTRTASSLALMPNAVGQSQILLLPPKQKPVRQGVYPFAVKVRSQVAQEEATIKLAQLKVLPLTEFKATVLPQRVTTRKKAHFRVSLANTGVSELSVGLEATDLDEGLKFRFKEKSHLLPPWSTVEIPLTAVPKRSSLVGERKQYDISLTAQSSDGKVQTATCVMHHRPRIGSWRPILRVLRILIALGILVVVVSFVLRWGGGWGTLTSSPQTFVDNFVSTIEGWFNR